MGVAKLKLAAVADWLLNQQNVKVSAVARRLGVAPATVYRWTKQGGYDALLAKSVRPRKNKPWRKLQARRREAKKLTLKKSKIGNLFRSDFPSCAAIRAEMVKTNKVPATISRSTIWRDLRRSLDSRVKPRVCTVDPGDHARRLAFAKNAVAWNARKIMFTDESTISINCGGRRRQWVPKGAKADPKLMATWPITIQIWGAIGHNFKKFVIIRTNSYEEKKASKKKRDEVGDDSRGGLNGTEYKTRCIDRGPGAHCVAHKWKWWHDGAKCHVACRPILINRGITVIDVPPRSPDCNVIEQLWSLIKHRVQYHCPQTRQELIAIVNKVLAELTYAEINPFVDSFRSKVQHVVDSNGTF